MSHEARRTDRRNDLEDIRRSGRRQYCECILGNRHLFDYSCRQHLDRCFRYSRRADKAELYQTRQWDRRSSRQSRFHNVDLEINHNYN